MGDLLILSSTYKPNIGGIEAFLENFIKLLSRKDKKVYLLTFKQDTYSKILKVDKLPSKNFEKGKNYEIHRFDFIDFGIASLFKTNFLRDLFSILNMFIYGFSFLASNNKKISIIHANDPPQAVVGFFLAKLFNKKCVVTLHNVYKFSGKGLRGIFGQIIFNRLDWIFAISNKIIKQLRKDDIKNNVSLSRYWINLRLFRPKKKSICRKSLNLSTKGFYTLFVGRVTEGKGIKQLVNASKSANEIKFLVVGSGDSEDYVKQNQNRNLMFFGPKSEKELVDCYNAADVSIFPTTYSYEGFGRVIIESLACGTPVLISKKMPAEAISNDVGKIISPNPKGIISSIKSFKKSLKNKSSLCRKFAIKNYSEKNADVILNVYKILASK